MLLSIMQCEVYKSMWLTTDTVNNGNEKGEGFKEISLLSRQDNCLN